MVLPLDEPKHSASSEQGVVTTSAAQAGLTGLYLWDSEAVVKDGLAFGVLVIEPPCIYINEIDQAAQPIRMPDGHLLRTFVRLPQSLVRFDAGTNSIWVREEGPMTTGDEVTLGGGYSAEAFGRRVFEDECSANASFTAASMSLGLDHMLAPGWDDSSMESRGLTNMFAWDPDGGFHDASVSGNLEIAPACTYVTDEFFVGCVAIESDPETEPRCVYVNSTEGIAATLAPDGTPIRTLVRLPRPLTRYDPDTGELWVGDRGPMASGDAVVLAGSVGWVAGDAPIEEPFEGRCAAHGSFWAASMRPIDSKSADLDTDDEQSPPLAGMFPWDPKQNVAWYVVDGALAIEAPCVYVDDITSWGDRVRRTGSDPTRLLVRLAQPLVRFDDSTGALWLGDDGPFFDGDRVSLRGGPNAFPGRDAARQVYDGGCSAHEAFWTLEIERTYR